MKSWRFVMSGPGTGPENMSIDEAMLAALADGKARCPTFRLYSWKAPCITIGYFQKYSDFAAVKIPVTRRLTGGLLVNHGVDLSYAFAASKDDWPHLYNQEKTYELIHAGLKRGIELMGIECSFYQKSSDTKVASAGTGICVQTFFPYDLHIGGRKILGSCQRRRGAVILQQGSLHLQIEKDNDSIGKSLAKGLAAELDVEIVKGDISSVELGLSHEIAVKYTSNEWNRKY